MAQRAILCFLCQSVKSVDSLPGLSSYRKTQIFSLRSLPSLRLRVTSAADSPRAEQLQNPRRVSAASGRPRGQRMGRALATRPRARYNLSRPQGPVVRILLRDEVHYAGLHLPLRRLWFYF